MGKKKKKYQNLMEMDDKEYLKYLEREGYEVSEPKSILGVLSKKQLKKIEKLEAPNDDLLEVGTPSTWPRRENLNIPYVHLMESDDEDDVEVLVPTNSPEQNKTNEYDDTDNNDGDSSIVQAYSNWVDGLSDDTSDKDTQNEYIVEVDSPVVYIGDNLERCDYVFSKALPSVVYSVDEFNRLFGALHSVPAQLCLFVEYNNAVMIYCADHEVFNNMEYLIPSTNTIDMSENILAATTLLDEEILPLDIEDLYNNSPEYKSIASEFYRRYKNISDRIGDTPMVRAVPLSEIKDKIIRRLTTFIYAKPIVPTISLNISEEFIEEVAEVKDTEETQDSAVSYETNDEIVDVDIDNIDIDVEDDSEIDDGDIDEDVDEEKSFIFKPMTRQ